MGELMLLERIEEALAEPSPEPITYSRSDDFDELKERALALIQKSKDRLAEMKRNVAALRQLDEHGKHFAEFWPELDVRLTDAIRVREDTIKKARIRLTDAPRVRSLKRKIEAQLIAEHRAVVDIYYTLKADADEQADDTHGTGEPLSSAGDISAYFDRVRSAR